MGGEGVQVSDASKTFQQQHIKQQQSNAMASSASSSAAGAYASMQQQHYSANNAALSPSSTVSSDDGQQQQANSSRNSMNNATTSSRTSSNSAGMDAQQHAQYQNQIMNAAAAMNSGAMSQVTCLVCYNAQVDVMLEPCHHQFHAHCIDRWLNKDKVCPICWIPIQTQRRILAPSSSSSAGLYNPQQQQQQQGNNANSGGSQQQQQQQNLSRGGYAPNTNANNSGPVGAMIALSNSGSAGAAPTDVPGGLAGVATMTNEPPNPATMRKGKWTAEESLYCDRLIEEFKKGNLPLAEGTTLRTFLSKLLNCDPMRISKKYTGDQCIGKIIFRRREDDVSKDDLELIRRDLAELEKTYLEREQYNQRRREKRLESELSRDKSRYIAARTLGYNSNNSGSGSTPTAVGSNAARHQVPVPVAPVGHYQQQQQQQIPASGPKLEPSPHHAQFPPTRGPMPLQHQSNPNVPRYPLLNHQQQHQQQQQQQAQQQQQLQQQQQQQHQQPPPQMQPPTSSHLFNSSMQSSSSSTSGPHYAASSDSSHNASSSSHTDPSGRPSNDGAFHSGSSASSQLTSSQHHHNQQQHQQHQQHQQQHQQHQQHQSQQQEHQSSGESFPRVSSIDSFSCLFPRVASIDNFQLPHQGGHNSNSHLQSSGYGGNSAGSFGESLNHSYDHANSNMVKSISIGDGLNAYFPRIQSLEQLSSLLQEHAPPSPRAKDENENESGSKSGKPLKEEGLSSLASASSSSFADRKRMFESHNASSSSSQMKEEQQRDADADLHRRLSPNNANKATEHSNQIQIPKPLSKMPRSSSGIFPRIPSMDKLPRIPSMDKLDKLPRIPSMDKLASSSMDKIPRIPSMDKLPRVPSLDKQLSHMSRIPSHSDMLSRFGSSDHLSSFPSFSNLSSLSTCASFTNLSGLGGGGGGAGGGGFKSGFPRNSSIEDILSLVASSENNSGMSSGSHLQLSALAAVAGEESSQMAAAADRKRRLEHAQEMENKKNKVST